MEKKDNYELWLEEMASNGTLIEKIDEFINDERIPSFPSDKYLTPKQWNALCGEIPMTQEMFDRILTVCDMLGDGVRFYMVIDQFPDLEVKHSKDTIIKYKQEYEMFKKEYNERFGEDGIFFQD